jgi:hypothetical protein
LGGSRPGTRLAEKSGNDCQGDPTWSHPKLARKLFTDLSTARGVKKKS